jgi:hypothetical protein
MEKEIRKKVITLTSFTGVKVSVDLPWDSTAQEVMEAFEAMMICVGFSKDWLKRFCEDYLEQNGETEND